MRSAGAGLLTPAVLAAFLAAGCGRPAPRPSPSPAASSLPSLPPGHPPIGGGSGLAVPPPPPGSGTGEQGLAWKPPAGWTPETPSSAMRRAQYRVSGPGGGAECVVFYFGPGQGGDARSNAERWASQFAQPDGRASSDVMKTSRLRVGDHDALLVEVTGTYSGGMAMGSEAPAPQPGAMLLGAIVQGPDANWFFKFTGPEATVRAQKGAFLQMVRSVE